MNNKSLKYKKDINECFYRNIFNVLFVTRNGQNYLLYKKNKKKYLFFIISLCLFE